MGSELSGTGSCYASRQPLSRSMQPSNNDPLGASVGGKERARAARPAPRYTVTPRTRSTLNKWPFWRSMACCVFATRLPPSNAHEHLRCAGPAAGIPTRSPTAFARISNHTHAKLKEIDFLGLFCLLTTQTLTLTTHIDPQLQVSFFQFWKFLRLSLITAFTILIEIKCFYIVKNYRKHFNWKI